MGKGGSKIVDLGMWECDDILEPVLGWPFVATHY